MIEIIPNWHPLFVHFTIALFSISAILFVTAKIATNWRLEDQWLATAYWNLWLAAIITIATVLAGWYAYNTVAHDTPSHEAMKEHRNWALITFTIILIMAGWGILQYRKRKEPALVFVIGMVAGFALVLTTAWHGGEIVYRYGLGVMSLPKTDSHQHAPGTPDHHDGAPSATDEHAHDSLTPDDHHDDIGAEGGHSHDNPATMTQPGSAPMEKASPSEGSSTTSPAHDDHSHEH